VPFGDADAVRDAGERRVLALESGDLLATDERGVGEHALEADGHLIGHSACARLQIDQRNLLTNGNSLVAPDC
jgi:hypothetical protein